MVPSHNTQVSSAGTCGQSHRITPASKHQQQEPVPGCAVPTPRTALLYWCCMRKKLLIQGCVFLVPTKLKTQRFLALGPSSSLQSSVISCFTMCSAANRDSIAAFEAEVVEALTVLGCWRPTGGSLRQRRDATSLARWCKEGLHCHLLLWYKKKHAILKGDANTVSPAGVPKHPGTMLAPALSFTNISFVSLTKCFVFPVFLQQQTSHSLL